MRNVQTFYVFILFYKCVHKKNLYDVKSLSDAGNTHKQATQDSKDTFYLVYVKSWNSSVLCD